MTKAQEIEQASKRKFNMKMFPIYEMFSYDLLFFYAIRVMFLSQVCGFQNSQIVFLSTIYSIVFVLFQIPVIILTSFIGNKNSALLGNVLNLIYIVVLIITKDYSIMIINEIISAVGFVLKINSEYMVLQESIPSTDNIEKNRIFTRIDRKGFTRFCIFSAFASLLSGFLYNVNHYLPLVLCIMCILASIFILFNFYDFGKKSFKMEKKIIKENLRNIKRGYRLTLKSKRLRALFLFVGIILSIGSLLTTYELVLLQFIGVGAGALGILYAIFEVSKGIFARRTFNFEKKFGNRTLKTIIATFAISFILMGVVAIFKIDASLKTGIIVLILLIDAGLIGMSEIINKKYLNNFSNDKISPLIYSSMQTVRGVFRTITTFVGSLILNFTSIDYAFLIFGIILIALSIIVSQYAENKLGLSPEKYTSSDNFNK